MGTGWRRAFCNTLPRHRRESTTTTGAVTAEADKQSKHNASRSTTSTPRLRCKTVSRNNSIDLVSPKLECKTTPTTPKTHSKIRFGSNPSSPRSPFSILKNTLRLSRNSCGVCAQSVKTGQGMAIYTAECSHAFHFPCIAAHVGREGVLVCPVCAAVWKDVPLLAVHTKNRNQIQNRQDEEKIVRIDSTTPADTTSLFSPKFDRRCDAASFADDEPLLTPKFNPIPESVIDDEEEVEEFQGFFVNPISSSDDAFGFTADSRAVEVSVLPDAAVISQGRTHDTYAIVLKVKAPPPPPPAQHAPDTVKRAPIDLVTVLDVSGSMTGAKLEMLKRAMRLVIASLASTDRLSILAFSAAPQRLLPLRRMTPQGQRAARRVIDRLSCSRGSSMAEALREATRVLEERRERNPVASIILLSDGRDDGTAANDERNQRYGSSHSTRFAHVEIPVHSAGFSRKPAENAFSKCVSGLLSVVVQDLRIQLGFASGSDPAEIMAFYSCNERPSVLGSGCARLGNLYAEEEKELLVEIRVPASRVGYGFHYVISLKCLYKDPATQELIYGKDQTLLVPRPQTVRSGLPKITWLRYVFITSRAVAESRRLVEHNELSSAVQLLSSARALLLQSCSELASVSAGEFIKELEAELTEVQWRRHYQKQMAVVRQGIEEREMGLVDEKGEPLTPTSAWRAAEKLAKVAQMKKSPHRVSDLHGFENARF